jgi:hypothetical protein
MVLREARFPNRIIYLVMKLAIFAVSPRHIFAGVGMSKWFNHVTRHSRVELNETIQYIAGR